MKSYHIPLLILLIISLNSIFNSCKMINNSNEDSLEKIFIVREINNITLEEFKEQFHPIVYPKKIILTKDEDYDFKGKVDFDPIGILQIQNYAKYTERKKSFYVDTKGILGPIESISFSEIEINSISMTGIYELCGPTIDTAPDSFKATRQFN